MWVIAGNGIVPAGMFGSAPGLDPQGQKLRVYRDVIAPNRRCPAMHCPSAHAARLLAMLSGTSHLCINLFNGFLTNVVRKRRD